MVSETLLTVIGGIIILALIIFAIYLRFKKNPSNNDKDLALEFLNGLSEVIYKKITDIINNINFFEYDSLIKLEAAVLNEIYDAVWEYVEGELAEAAKTDILTAMTLKVLNKEFVDKFLDNFLEKHQISAKIEERYNSYTESLAESIEEEDKRLQEQFSDPSQYNQDTSVDDLPKYQPEEISEEVLSSLIPQKEEEEEYVENDETMEILDDDTYIDSNGRLRSKTTGKFVKR